MGIAALVAAALGLVVYLPAGLLLTRIATPYRIQLTTTPFQAGDVVLHNRSAYLFSDPQPGDVVLYDVAYMNARYLGQNYVIREGAVIDRILAGPGSDVTCEQGTLVVDGRRCPWQPLNPAAMPGNWSTTVPANHYLVLPTTSPQWRAQVPGSLQLSVATVPRDYIRGSVYLRHQPFWRIWWIR